MKTEMTAVVITALGFIASVISSAFISGMRWGSMKTRLENLEHSQKDLATKDQLAGVKEDVAEIKGMFRMTLKSEGTL